MKATLLLFTIATALSACASISPAEKQAATQVKVTDVTFLNNDGKSCRNLGRVTGDSVGALGGQSAAIEHMRVNAVKVGANIVVSNLSFTTVMGIAAPADQVNGIALFCPEGTYAKIVSIEQLANY